MQTTKTELTAADLKVGQMVWIPERKVIGRIIGIKTYKTWGDLVIALPDYSSPPFNVSEIKPILRPVESMNEAELETYNDLRLYSYSENGYNQTIQSVLYLIDNGFDVRGWIGLGLAVDAATVEGDGE